MKQYKLAAWPDLGAPFHRMPYRRMLHQMSQRHVSLQQLSRHSGLERKEVRHFIDTLAERALLVEREHIRPWAWVRSMQRLLKVVLA